MSDRPRVAIIGSKGIPARYGGFESFVEDLAPRLVHLGWDVTVYCRRDRTGPVGPTEDTSTETWYRGVRLVTTPFVRVAALETLTHEATAFAHALRDRPDVYYVLGTRAAPVAVLGKGRPILMHTDGLEWKRRKWGRAGRTFLRFAEWCGASFIADRLIADAEAMADHYRDRYGKEATVIHYGVDVVDPAEPAVLARYDLTPGSYDLVVCRLEPENNIDAIIAGHRASGVGTELVIVGGTDYDGDYQRGLRSSEEAGRVRFLGPIYDDVDHLYAGAARYLHGHEVGGMNPSLLRAMGAGTACFALDTPFAREALGDTGVLWRKDDLARVLRDTPEDALGSLGDAARDRAAVRFTWDRCAQAHVRVLDQMLPRRG